MSVFPSRVRVYRPGAGTYDADSRFTPGVDVEVHEGAANVQEQARTLAAPRPDGTPAVVLEEVVYLDVGPYDAGVIGPNAGPVAGDYVEVTDGDLVRRGEVQAVRRLNQSLVVGWAE